MSAVRRWTDSDEASWQGRQMDPEIPADPADRDFARLLAPFGSLLLAYSHLAGAEKWRGKNSVALEGETLAIEIKGKVRHVVLTDCVGVFESRSPRTQLLVVELKDGEKVELPDAVYPSARGAYASQRHKRLMNQIKYELNRAIEKANSGQPRES